MKHPLEMRWINEREAVLPEPTEQLAAMFAVKPLKITNNTAFDLLLYPKPPKAKTFAKVFVIPSKHQGEFLLRNDNWVAVGLGKVVLQ